MREILADQLPSPLCTRASFCALAKQYATMEREMKMEREREGTGDRREK